MNKLLLFLILFATLAKTDTNKNQFIARQGQVTFFSYTSAENI